MEIDHSDRFNLEAALATEQSRLVRLCAYLTGDTTAADDLAQETLIEAWRNAHKLYEPTGYAPWLSAIARNVCLRHARRQGRELAREESLSPEQSALPDTLDLEVELSRTELATLLDRALALLPADTRSLLIERFVTEAPIATLAEKFGLTENSANVRLHRGKLTLRRLLTTHLRAEAADLGLLNADSTDWQETHVWCPQCGRQRLVARLTHSPPEVAFRCPGCVQPAADKLWETNIPALVANLHGFRASAQFFLDWTHDYYQTFATTGRVRCPVCGAELPAHLSAPYGETGLTAQCGVCQVNTFASLSEMILAHPTGRQFWRANPRVQVIPEQVIEAAGRPVIATGLRSLTNSAGLALLFDRETLQMTLKP